MYGIEERERIYCNGSILFFLPLSHHHTVPSSLSSLLSRMIAASLSTASSSAFSSLLSSVAVTRLSFCRSGYGISRDPSSPLLLEVLAREESRISRRSLSSLVLAHTLVFSSHKVVRKGTEGSPSPSFAPSLSSSSLSRWLARFSCRLLSLLSPHSLALSLPLSPLALSHSSEDAPSRLSLQWSWLGRIASLATSLSLSLLLCIVSSLLFSHTSYSLFCAGESSQPLVLSLPVFFSYSFLSSLLSFRSLLLCTLD